MTPNEIEASMRPGRFGPGNSGSHLAKTVSLASFNEAGALWPRKSLNNQTFILIQKLLQ